MAKLGLDKVNADAAAAAASAAAFITNAVKEAKAHGLEFTEEEAKAFMAAEAKAAASGELSDTQLEAVAGGKGFSLFPPKKKVTFVDQYGSGSGSGRSDAEMATLKSQRGY